MYSIPESLPTLVHHPYFTYVALAVGFIVLPFLGLFLLKVAQRLTTGRCRSLVCLNGKTAIVTGASSGIGYETALLLASRGCKVILADREGAANAKEKIASLTNNSGVVAKTLDLSSFQSIRKFAKEVTSQEERLDILINNATFGRASTKNTDDGLNRTMQINHFGPFLLTHLLADLLKKSAPSRIIFVSGASAFFWTNLSVKNLNFPQDLAKGFFSSSFIYGNSKLANIISANGFADRLKDYGVTSNSLHPGLVQVELGLKDWRTAKLAILRKFVYNFVLYMYGKTPKQGAQTTLSLAISNHLKAVTGKHFWDCRSFMQPPKAWSEKFCDKIWVKSEELVQLKPNEKLSPVENIFS